MLKKPILVAAMATTLPFVPAVARADPDPGPVVPPVPYEPQAPSPPAPEPQRGHRRPGSQHLRAHRAQLLTRKIALVPAVLAAGITYAAPAHALPILHWEGASPRGGMIVVAGGGHLPVHAEVNTINGVMHMTAANGCDENWLNTGRNETVINGIDNGFVDVRVNSGQGPGCQPTGTYPAQMNIQNTGGGNYTMTVDETPFMAGPDGAATWVLFGHDG